MCAYRLEGLEEPKVFGFCQRAEHPDEEQAGDSRAAVTVCPSDRLNALLNRERGKKKKKFNWLQLC